LITTLDELGRAVLAELQHGGVTYSGLGSLPMHDSRAMRDRPLLRDGDGLLNPLGFGLLLDPSVDLPRYVVERSGKVGGDRLLRNVLGHAFEAYASDRIVELRGRHQVLTEHQITAVLGPHARRGDAVIGYNGDYVLVEISVQALNRGIAAGDPAMVVTDQALPASPALADALRRIHPACTPRFLCSIDELELLVDAGHRGWSVPGMVGSWKAGARADPSRPPAPADPLADPAGGSRHRTGHRGLARRAPHRRPAGRMSNYAAHD
jgi:hypothetical protein